MTSGARQRSSSRKKRSESRERETKDASLPPILDRGNSTPRLGRASSLDLKSGTGSKAESRADSRASDPAQGVRPPTKSRRDGPTGARPPRPPGEKWWITANLKKAQPTPGGYCPASCSTPKVNLTPLDNAPPPPLSLSGEQLAALSITQKSGSGYPLQKEGSSKKSATAPLLLRSEPVELDRSEKAEPDRSETALSNRSEVDIFSDSFCCALCETGSDDSGAPVVRFSRGGAMLTSFSLRPLAVVLEALGACPELALTVIGHARSDEDAGLALKRAEVSVKHLCSEGVGKDRLKVTVCGASESLAGSAVTFVRTDKIYTPVRTPEPA